MTQIPRHLSSQSKPVLHTVSLECRDSGCDSLDMNFKCYPKELGWEGFIVKTTVAQEAYFLVVRAGLSHCC